MNLTADLGDEHPPHWICLDKGQDTTVRQVLRVMGRESEARVDVVPHPAEKSQGVRVSNLIELVRVH